MDQEITVKVDSVYKDFLLPHEKADSIKSAFTGMLKGKKGRTIERQHALHDIDFEIKKGEFFGIVGRNGSGKSTLLKIIAGIYQPTKGKVTTNGRLVPFIELGVGFNPELTGRENVYLNGALMGFSHQEIDAKYEAIVDFAEIHRFMDQKLKNYSSGMQVRLAFSVATILAESDILLIDEVLAVGDADFQRKCFRYFKKLKRDNKTVIFVTHDMNAVREYCDRAAFIEDSKQVAVGKPNEISKMYEKLLRPKSEASDINTDESDNRWGDGIVKFVGATVSQINEEKIELTTPIKAWANCDDAILGFVIKNGAGLSILGTNTLMEKVKLPAMMKGQQIQVVWSFANVLADGEYLVTMAATRDSGSTTCDWWEEACNFSITQAVRSPFLVAPKIQIKVEGKT